MGNATSALDIAIGAWVLLLGSVVGSFLNVVVARLPHGQSIVRPRSHCSRCSTPIAWYDNLPLVSWVLLRARCRACRTYISVRYPLVETLGAGAAWLGWTRHGLTPTALAEFALVAAFITLAFIDLDTWLLPNVITWPLIVCGLVANALDLAAARSIWSAAAGTVAGFLAFALISVVGKRVFRREALGFGDVWLLAGIGAWLGAEALLPVVLLASVQGTVVGLILILLGKATPGPEEKPTTLAPATNPTTHPADDDWVPPKNSVPFGPFLVAAALEWLYLADPITRLITPLQVFR